jgi:hypothetical protein
VAERVEQFAPEVPAGTAATSPFSATFSMSPGVVERVEIRVPPGPSGFMGFRLLHSGQVVIPFDQTDWLIADDEKMDWPLRGYPTGDKWSVQMYNEGIYDHTVYFRFFLDEIPQQTALSLVPIVME